MYIRDLRRKKRLENQDLLSCEKTRIVNNFFEEIYNKLTDVYESVMDGETELSNWEVSINKKASD